MTDIAAGNDEIGPAPQPRWRRIIVWSALVETVAAEGERRILWLPVWFGTGIALYFALTIEPPLWLGAALTLAAATAALALRRHR
ncbi:MAG: hypothetical protein ACREFB_18675, partial [Stellaceae bacterium]